jgi:threonine/homoserine/homoserine lactone efflux protein
MTLLLAMFLFSLVMSISPGPVNMIILSSGISYGIKRTIPYVSGATFGFTLLLLFIGFGFSQFIKAYPFFLSYLAIVGSLYT